MTDATECIRLARSVIVNAAALDSFGRLFATFWLGALSRGIFKLGLRFTYCHTRLDDAVNNGYHRYDALTDLGEKNSPVCHLEKAAAIFHLTLLSVVVRG